MALIVHFPSKTNPASADCSVKSVGGKGRSLIFAAQGPGLTVPPGFVLTTRFFEAWLRHLHQSDIWAAFTKAQGDQEIHSVCDKVKAMAERLPLTPEQEKELRSALGSGDFSSGLVAVRSSSPEEDTGAFSFAGMYETVLGVPVVRIEQAMRHVFASAFDERIVAYKKQHSQSLDNTCIAVVVQRQIMAEVAGVAFSVDPITNSEDDVVVTANWGLGESVVSGLCSPDQFTVDKHSGEVTRSTLGAKETAVHVGTDESEGGGSTVQRGGDRRSEFCIGPDKLREVCAMVVATERLFDQPVDTEWALSEGRVYLLQARPITTVFRLPANLMTERGQQRVVYLDVLQSVQGIKRPMSILGTSLFQRLIYGVLRSVFGVTFPHPRVAPVIVSVESGHFYVNASIISALTGFSLSDIADKLKNMDVLAAESLRNVRPEDYPAPPAPIRPVLRLLWFNPRSVFSAVRAWLWPEHRGVTQQRQFETLFDQLCQERVEGLTPTEVVERFAGRATDMIKAFLPSTIAVSRTCMGQIVSMFANDPESVQRDADQAIQSLPHNITIELGASLEALAARLRATPFLPGDSPVVTASGLTQHGAPRGAAQLQDALEQGRWPEETAETWERLLRRYGHRSAEMEIDIAAPRFSEDATYLMDLLASLYEAPAPPSGTLEAAYAKREEALQRLVTYLRENGRARDERKLMSNYAAAVALGGFREHPKFMIVKIISLVRTSARAMATRLVANGLLDAPEHIFDLTLDQLANRAADLRADRASNLAVRQGLATKSAPKVFDSRARIFHPPPRAAVEGMLVGTGVSMGTVQGRVKVLLSPREKPLLPGEILVAPATDPGWTPLFVNAAAVVLEIGGMLQHGALVAREYGKPCVVGVEHVTTELHDGELVEVDGTAGTVRFLERAAPASAPAPDARAPAAL